MALYNTRIRLRARAKRQICAKNALRRGELRRVAVRRRRMWSRVGVRGGAASRDGRQARADDRQET
eukprot:5161278-Alexandrium_andersonii.AAC.1